MKETQEQQADNDDLIPRKTGNDQLDRLLNETASIPLAINSGQISQLLSKSGGSSGSRMRNVKWIIAGAIVVTGLVLYSLLPLNKDKSVIKNIPASQPVKTVRSDDNNNATSSIAATAPAERSSSKINVAPVIENKTSVKNNVVKSTTNKNSIYLEGTTTVILEHEGKSMAVELNQSGVKKIIDDGKVVNASDYYAYNEIIQQAYAKTSFKYKPEEKHDLSEKEKLAEAIIQGLYKQNLLLEGQPYDLVITPESAVLNDIVLSPENHKTMLDIVEQTTGKSLPPKGKIHIRH